MLHMHTCDGVLTPGVGAHRGRIWNVHIHAMYYTVVFRAPPPPLSKLIVSASVAGGIQQVAFPSLCNEPNTYHYFVFSDDVLRLQFSGYHSECAPRPSRKETERGRYYIKTSRLPRSRVVTRTIHFVSNARPTRSLLRSVTCVYFTAHSSSSAVLRTNRFSPQFSQNARDTLLKGLLPILPRSNPTDCTFARKKSLLRTASKRSRHDVPCALR